MRNEEIIKIWNAMAVKNGLPQIKALTPKRVARLRECKKSITNLKDWEIAINEVAKSKFHLGENDRKWKAGFDWFCNSNMPCLNMLEKASVTTLDKKQHGRFNTDAGYKKTENGVDNDTASRQLGDILKGIL